MSYDAARALVSMVSRSSSTGSHAWIAATMAALSEKKRVATSVGGSPISNISRNARCRAARVCGA